MHCLVCGAVVPISFDALTVAVFALRNALAVGGARQGCCSSRPRVSPLQIELILVVGPISVAMTCNEGSQPNSMSYSKVKCSHRRGTLQAWLAELMPGDLKPAAEDQMSQQSCCARPRCMMSQVAMLQQRCKISHAQSCTAPCTTHSASRNRGVGAKPPAVASSA